MRFSDIQNDRPTVKVEWQGHTITFTYDRWKFTPKYMEEAGPYPFHKVLAHLVYSWDLKDDRNRKKKPAKTVEEDDDQKWEMFPITEEALSELPWSLIQTVYFAIQRDQVPKMMRSED